MYAVNKLYKTRKSGTNTTGPKTAVRLEHATALSLTIYGSVSKPTGLSDMLKLDTSMPFNANDWYYLEGLPPYIAFAGTVDLIEVSYAALEEIGDIT